MYDKRGIIIIKIAFIIIIRFKNITEIISYEEKIQNSDKFCRKRSNSQFLKWKFLLSIVFINIFSLRGQLKVS